MERSSPRRSLADLARALRLLPRLLDDGWIQLRAQSRQHALTLIGIVWGAAAVVLLLSFGSGLFRFLDLGFKKTGDRVPGNSVSDSWTKT